MLSESEINSVKMLYKYQIKYLRGKRSKTNKIRLLFKIKLMSENTK